MSSQENTERVFGEYRCPKCRRLWCSANSWINIAQKCIKRKIDVYTHKQTPLEKPTSKNKIDPNKPHLQELCGMCKKLGRSCESVNT